jgi:hypothetical protein
MPFSRVRVSVPIFARAYPNGRSSNWMRLRGGRMNTDGVNCGVVAGAVHGEGCQVRRRQAIRRGRVL